MRSFFKRAKEWISSFVASITPGPVAIKGASRAIGATTLIIWLICSLAFFVFGPKTWFGVFPVLLIPVLALMLGGLATLTIKLLGKIPKSIIWVLPGTYLLMSLSFGQGALDWQFPLLILVFAGGAGAALYTLTKPTRKQNTLRQRITAFLGLLTGTAGLAWGLIWAFDTGFKPDPQLINASLTATYRPNQIDLPNPGEAGPYQVEYLTYGSGKDKHRPEYGSEVALRTDSVDGSRLIDNWEGLSGKARTKFWGFDDESLPINGRVWHPKGEGPFPLALIVHGNHSMYDYSDPGYAYLGELLASHGIIMVSVDENFINSGWTDVLTDGLDEENDARGWLLLKHLEQWREWNKDANNPFYQKVDMENLAVMGHSRGGEAAAVAGFFNQLEFYPDDAKEKFNFGFNIKAVVSIAPVDGQYKPGEVGTPLSDVNYLVLHGSNDGDVQSFGGLRQYERLTFSDSTDFFKSAVYVYGANHGQFNTTWGNKDSSYPWASLLNLDALMPMEDQLTIGKVFINGFLLSTLKGQRAYHALFKDYRTGKDWLPETIYLNQFEASGWENLSTYDEDLDLTSMEHSGHISSENLTVWREQLVNMKWGNKGTRAVYIGWDSTAYPQDTAKYSMAFDPHLNMTENHLLSFELAQSKESSYPDKERDEKKREAEKEAETLEEGNNNNQEEAEDEEVDKDKEDDDEKKAPEPINLSLIITDSSGESIKFDLNEFALLQPQLTVDIYKNKSLQSNKTSEAVYQTYFFDLAELDQQNPDFNRSEVMDISFVFDQTKSGVIILDKIALHK